MKKIMISLVFSFLIYLIIALVLIVIPVKRETPENGLDFDVLAKVENPITNVEEKFYKARDGSQLFYRYLPGDSNFTVVLLHGSGTDGRYLLPLAEKMNKGGIAVVIPDLRGHGRSMLSHAGDVAYLGQLEDDLADLYSMIRGDDYSKVIVLGGHSSGGGLALKYNANQSEQYDGYILLAPYLGYQSPTIRPDSGGWVQVAKKRYAGLAMLNNAGITVFNDWPVIFFNRPEKWSDSLQVDNYTYRMNESFSPSYPDDLQKADSTVLALMGAQDEAFYPDEFTAVFQKYAPEATVHLIEGAKHLDLPDHQKVADIIVEWLD